MIRTIMPLFCALFLTGCEDADTNMASQPSQKTEQAVAIFTCTVNGTPLGVAACFGGGDESLSGDLKVRNGHEVKQYTIQDIYGAMNTPAVEIPLIEPFEIEAQTTGEDAYVLRIVIRSDGQTIFQDEASSFGVITVDSDSL